MKTHFFLKALSEGAVDGFGRTMQIDFDLDFGYSRDSESSACECLAECFSNFLNGLGYEGSFIYFTPDELDQPRLPSSKFPLPPIPPGDDEVMLNELRQPNPEKEGTNGK